METTQTSNKAKVKNQVIETTLIGKEEVFKILSVAKALGLPVLLIGSPGVSKTGSVLDHAKAFCGGDFDATLDKTFILETDEGTKSSEIKGTLDVKKLVLDNEFGMSTPITKAEYIVINEVDKASSGLRNAMLGVMNEKVLFNGDTKTKCNWKVFVATANEIPKEEIGSPFWDRFQIKFKVDRISNAQMMKYYKQGDKGFKTTVNVPDPTEEEIQAVAVPLDKLEVFLGLCSKQLTDRTLSFVPRMARVVSLIYNCGIESALVKVCDLLTNNKSLSQELHKKLAPQEKRAILDKVDMLSGITDETQLQNAVQEIENLVNKYEAAKKLSETDLEEIANVINSVMENHPIASIQGIDIN